MEATMHFHEESDCVDTLLDLVCYEVLRKKLTPEMERVLDRHLRSCPSCRRKVMGFQSVLRGDAACANFG
jgi:hypothetical protein